MGYRLGVDLGTTFTAAAVTGAGGPSMLGLGNRATQVPSVVFVQDDGQFLFGEAAERRGVTDPSRLAHEFKRRIGDHVPILIAGSPYAAQTLTGHLLGWVVETATERMGETPDHVTVTHPATWGPYKQDLFRQSLEIAGVPDADRCPEPLAAAARHAARSRVPEGAVITVYDLGGGTFDVAVLQKSADGFRLLGTPDGLEHLGGVDFDEAVFRHVLGGLGDLARRLDPDDPGVMAGLARLRRDCVEAKEALSADVDTEIPVGLGGESRFVRLTRTELETLIRPPLLESVSAVRRALRSAGTPHEDLDSIVLVGGSSRIPLVSQLLRAEFDVPIAVDIHPKHDVALGAALVDGSWDPSPALAVAVRRRQDVEPAARPPSVPPPIAENPTGLSPSPVATAAAAAPPAELPPPTLPPAEPSPAALSPAELSPAEPSPAEPSPAEPSPPEPSPAEPSPPEPSPAEPSSAEPSPAALRQGRPAWWAPVRSRVGLLAAGVVAAIVVAVFVLVSQLAGDDDGDTTASGTTTSATTTTTTTTTTTPSTGLPGGRALSATELVIAAGPSSQATDLWLVDSADTTQRRRLTSGPGAKSSISLSPDRRSVVYARQDDSDSPRRRRVAGAVDGDGDRLLFTTTPPTCARDMGRPAWVPSEPVRLVLVCQDEDSTYRLHLVTLDGTIERTFAIDLPRMGDPAVSPDGTTVVLWLADESNFDGGHLFTIPLAGGEPTQLTRGGELEGPDADPIYAPDGERIAFRRRLPDGSKGGSVSIFTMKADGTDVQQITDVPEDDQDPAYSPDGTLIAYKHQVGPPDSPVTRTYVVEADGSGDPRPLLPTGLGEFEAAVAWSRR